MPKTDSRKAKQRRRFQKRRAEDRKRVHEVKLAPKVETLT